MSKSSSLIGGLFFVVLFVIGFLVSRGCDDDSPEIVKRTQLLLGTVVEIQIRGIEEEKAVLLIQNAFDEIKRIDELFTTYNEESPVWIANNSKDSLISTNEEIYLLMTLGDSVYNITGGAFDVSLNNLIEAWGFDTDEPAVPSKEKLDSALAMSGWKYIKLHNNKSFTLLNNAELNFGAIAKGYAVDRAIALLDSSGVKEALVNAGGEIKTIGTNWVVGIQHPRNTGEITKKIKLENTSVATSGDYEQYFIHKGKRYHHILNPSTGYPAEDIQSVTIINKSNTFADALATGVFVLGSVEGMNLIEETENTEGMIIDGNGNIIFSTGFEKFLVK